MKTVDTSSQCVYDIKSVEHFKNTLVAMYVNLVKVKLFLSTTPWRRILFLIKRYGVKIYGRSAVRKLHEFLTSALDARNLLSSGYRELFPWG